MTSRDDFRHHSYNSNSHVIFVSEMKQRAVFVGLEVQVNIRYDTGIVKIETVCDFKVAT